MKNRYFKPWAVTLLVGFSAGSVFAQQSPGTISEAPGSAGTTNSLGSSTTPNTMNPPVNNSGLNTPGLNTPGTTSPGAISPGISSPGTIPNTSSGSLGQPGTS